MSQNVEPIRRIRDESIRTGEAVQLTIYPASPLVRAVSLMVDTLVTVLISAPVAIAFFSSMARPSDSMIRVLGLGGIFLFTTIIPLAIESLTQGRSLGKWVFGLQVVRDDGGVITIRHSLTRVLCGIVEIYFSLGLIALVSSLVSPRSKRLGDWLAGTMVVQKPTALTYAPVIMPPDLTRWADTAQILDPGQQARTAALRLIHVLPSLEPRARQAAAEEMAQRFSAFVDPQPPHGTNPERFIAAVLVVQRDRDYRRACQDQKRTDRILKNYRGSRYGIE